MNNMIMDNTDVVYYVVRVNGQNMTRPTSTKVLAEAQIQDLEPSLRAMAEVVAVTADGKQVLFG